MRRRPAPGSRRRASARALWPMRQCSLHHRELGGREGTLLEQRVVRYPHFADVAENAGKKQVVQKRLVNLLRGGRSPGKGAGKDEGMVADALEMVAGFRVPAFGNWQGQKSPHPGTGFAEPLARPARGQRVPPGAGFGDEVVRARLHAFHEVRHIVLPGKDDEAGVLAGIVPPNIPAQVRAVHAGQAPVGDNHPCLCLPRISNAPAPPAQVTVLHPRPVSARSSLPRLTGTASAIRTVTASFLSDHTVVFISSL